MSFEFGSVGGTSVPAAAQLAQGAAAIGTSAEAAPSPMAAAAAQAGPAAIATAATAASGDEKAGDACGEEEAGFHGASLLS
ncbi:MAG: hypothetical protein ABT25_11340 [Variovorax sp. SCN 67-20]|nr:MAG: hypothetical protein ABT25_11340 [Variovorax sp. SCN 67-20]